MRKCTNKGSTVPESIPNVLRSC